MGMWYKDHQREAGALRPLPITHYQIYMFVRWLIMIIHFHGPLLATGLLRKFFTAAGFTLALLLPMTLQAQRAYDAREVAMLPPYCKHTQEFRERVPGGNNPVEIERWTTLMGGAFNNMHHYCWGLMASNRASFSSPNRQERMRNLNDSIGEFNYVIERAPANFALLPEIYTKKGENLIRLGKGPHGVLELNRAIDIKPDYWPPYAAMSDYYKEIGDSGKAREWLEKGLSTSPNTKALMRRLAELDGPNDKRKAPPRLREIPTAPQSPAGNSAVQPAEPQSPAER